TAAGAQRSAARSTASWSAGGGPSGGSVASSVVPVAMPRCRVAAIVLNFRLAEETLRVVGELRGLGDGELCSIVVENGSADGSAERLGTALRDDPRSTLLVAEQNLGYCGGVNLALRAARAAGAEHALLLNNDCRVPPDFLAPLVAALDADRSLAGVAPTIVTPDGRAWSEGGVVRARANLVVLRGQGREPAPRT